MPKTSVPTTNALTVLAFGEADKKAYSFFNDRWDGEEGWFGAEAARKHFTKQGWTAGIHEGSVSKWEKGKSTDQPYFKLYVVHPEDKSLYAWWAPIADEWLAPIDAAILTWFEFVQADEDKKK